MNGDEEFAAEWLERPGLPRLAYRRTAGRAPGIIFMGGFASDMTGNKAAALESWARSAGHAFMRFDYRGHGRSAGRFEDAAIGDWLADGLAVMDMLTDGPQILVGSSMGGWIALLMALARPNRVTGLVGIAAAPDFTERLIWKPLLKGARERLLRDGMLQQPSKYGPPTPIMLRLIEDGRSYLLLDKPIPFQGRVRLLHGQRDADVPWATSLEIAERLETADVRVALVKDGDHRLSRPQDIALILQAVEELTL